MTRPLTFWPCGGDVVATHGRVIEAEEARRLRAFYLATAERSAALGDGPGHTDALVLAGELGHALDAAARWRRACAGRHAKAR